MHALLAQDGPALDPWLLVAAAGVLALVILLLAAPLLRRRNDPPAQVKDRSSSPASSAAALRPIGSASAGASGEYRAIERDIQTLIAELSEMTRRANAQFDARAAKLEQLLHEADDRLARLAAATGSAGAGGAGGAGGDGAIGPSRISVPAATPSSDDGIDPRHVEIYTLCEQGFSPQQIAERLKRPSGEVELIIALRPRSHALDASGE